ncbi:hypothetical protein [Frankia sp. R82]|uniref:hypothetical protein n=1 Tax=Frankia sp. R82 TaxID=2950553 RepID=UPI00204361E8|nr:hypothetical protein [Frankia sp. R82]MCM3883849.1 hypothetical protein [Frankia sp. R82]
MMRRSHRRGETSRGYSGRQLERSLDALRAPEFARHLRTDALSISAVADGIATHAGFTLSPDTSRDSSDRGTSSPSSHATSAWTPEDLRT